MLDFVFLFGAAAISYALMQQLSGKSGLQLRTAAVPLLVFAFLDFAVCTGVMRILKRPFINTPLTTGGAGLEIGLLACAVMLAAACLTGVLGAVLRANIYAEIWYAVEKDEASEG